jgi:hypothetical protein
LENETAPDGSIVMASVSPEALRTANPIPPKWALPAEPDHFPAMIAIGAKSGLVLGLNMTIPPDPAPVPFDTRSEPSTCSAEAGALVPTPTYPVELNSVSFKATVPAEIRMIPAPDTPLLPSVTAIRAS